MLKSIRRDQVRLGMYVCRLEGSWLRHPFWRRRFLLDNPADLVTLLDSDVQGVVIDTARGADVTSAAPAPDRAPPIGPLPRQIRPPLLPATPPPAGRDEARAAAARTVSQARRMVRDVFEDARLGRAIRSEAVQAVVGDVSDALERNKGAMLSVLRLKTKDEYTYLHSVAVCALMVNLARELRLPEAEVAELGTAGLLHDVGKMGVPSAVLNKPARLTDEEFALMQTHPEQGWRMLSAVEGMPALALDVCRHHHEKIDGTGYPHRLAGDAISLAARMGAICDVYDALTSRRVYKDAWPPTVAIARMREWSGQFDPDLLTRFMLSIGVFPAGMLVRLRSNRLGLILDNGRRASRPRALAFWSTRTGEWLAEEEVAIGDDLSHDGVLAEADPVAFGVPADALADLRARVVPAAQPARAA